METKQIYIFGKIGENYRVDGNLFAQQIREADEDESINLIEILLNSPGGEILDGFSICNAIQNAQTEIHTIVVGVAASMAAIILLFGDKIFMNDFSRIMLHSPSIGGVQLEDMEEGNGKNALTALRDSLSSIIQSRTGMDETKVNKILTAETWLSAKQAKSKKLIDEILKSDLKIKNDLSTEEILSQVCNYYKPKTKTKMKNILAHLKFDEEKTEVDVLDYIKNLETELDTNKATIDSFQKNENEEIVNKVEELKEKATEIETLTNELEIANKDIEERDLAIAVNIVDKAIEDGKFAAKDKENLVKRCVTDVEDFKNLISSIYTQRVSLENIVNQAEENEAEKTKIEENETWSELSKTNPEKLQKIMDENPEKYIELYKEEFGAEPNL